MKHDEAIISVMLLASATGPFSKHSPVTAHALQGNGRSGFGARTSVAPGDAWAGESQLFGVTTWGKSRPGKSWFLYLDVAGFYPALNMLTPRRVVLDLRFYILPLW